MTIGDEEFRQALFLIIGCLCGIIGSVANYIWMKHQKGEDPTREGTSKAAVFGSIAGFLIWLTNTGGDGIYHMTYMGMCFAAGVTAETMVGKAIGSIRARK